MWLVLGGILLYFGLSAYVWEKINAKHLNDSPMLSMMIRGSFILGGGALVSSFFPAPFTALEFPGWFVIGVLLLIFAQTQYFWKQYASMCENDKEWVEIFYVTRFLLTLVSIVLIGLGIFDGVPDVVEQASALGN